MSEPSTHPDLDPNQASIDPAPDLRFIVRDAVGRHSMNTARSQQSAARLIGPSEVGGCRAYLARVVADVPFDDMSHDVKWAAFVGTAIGDHIEAAMVAENPHIRRQVPVQTTFPSGLRISGNADLVDPGRGVMDIKSVDGLESVKRTGPSFQQLAQIMTYLLGLIQAGDLPPEATWALIFVDRSGADDTPHVVEGSYDQAIIDQIDDRLQDVVYAVEHDLNSAPRDQPFDWCVKVCPMFTKCRGADEHLVTGLIESEEHRQAVKLYAEGQALAKAGKALMEENKKALAGVSGSTGEVEVSWTHVGETRIAAHVRPGYDRLTLRPVSRGRKKTSSPARNPS